MTAPIMDSRIQPRPLQPPAQPSPSSERWGPEIYMHLEFRVSWGSKKQQQPSKNHQVTYRSRGARERAPTFPRQVPAPNTNYLAAIHHFDQRQSRIREGRHHHNHHPSHHANNNNNNTTNNPLRHHQMQEYYQAQQQLQGPRGHLQVPIIREPQRPTRADTRQPSYERGRSAPPPIGENPWDVNVAQLQMRNSDYRTPATEIKRKPLPAPPSQFRLGDGGQPWSTWSLPDGYDPDMHPKDDDYEHAPTSAEPADRNSTTFATNPTMVSTFSPEASSSPVRTRDLETGRTKDLGALSAAMMTVDNGFETQWWNQGQRKSVLTDDPTTPDESPIHRWSTNRMSASTTSPTETTTPMRALPTGVVSPMTEAAFSPAQVPASLMQRTMSTRSEELWFHERTRR